MTDQRQNKKIPNAPRRICERWEKRIACECKNFQKLHQYAKIKSSIAMNTKGVGTGSPKHSFNYIKMQQIIFYFTSFQIESSWLNRRAKEKSLICKIKSTYINVMLSYVLLAKCKLSNHASSKKICLLLWNTSCQKVDENFRFGLGIFNQIKLTLNIQEWFDNNYTTVINLIKWMCRRNICKYIDSMIKYWNIE